MEDRRNPSGQRPKKRKRGVFYGNQHSIENVLDATQSASARKIDRDSNNENEYNFAGFIIVDYELLFTALKSALCCVICHGSIEIDSKPLFGLAQKIVVSCKNCGDITSQTNAKNHELNTRFTYAMRCIGQGLAGCRKFCSVMDMPPPVVQSAYKKIVQKIHSATSLVARESMKKAVHEETKLTDSTDLTVSGDGTWKTRGHSSLVGVCSVIGSESGKVIDAAVLSSYCKGCDSWKGARTGQAYEKWEDDHKHSCVKNHSGSSGKMEMDGMVSIVNRSLSQYGVRYVQYIGDGDCKTFLAIRNSQPYANTDVKKIECVGHVQKRMGTRLRKLKQEYRGKKLLDNKSLGGKGRLTDAVIDQLTTYFGNAIRKHSHSVKSMQQAIWAIWYHKRSTDEEPLHELCPTGINSWCKYQRACAENKHETFKHKNSLPPEVMDCIKKVFKDLSHPEFLERCLGGKTQNVNESLNALIWKYCPKTSNAGRQIVEIAVNQSIVNFNDGKKGQLQIMRELKVTPGVNAQRSAASADMQRIRTSQMRTFSSSLEARIAKRQETKSLAEQLNQDEGDVYVPGGFST